MRTNPSSSTVLSFPTEARPLDLWITLASLCILIPICLWVFRDARKRYPGAGLPLLWAVLVFLALIVFLPLYLFLRPPKR